MSAVSVFDADFLGKVLAKATMEHQGMHSGATSTFLQAFDRAWGEKLIAPDIMETAAARQIMHREAPISNQTEKNSGA